MRNAVLYAHSGSGNHGCEALLRTTSAFLLENGFGDVSVISRSPDEDKKYFPDFSGEIKKQEQNFRDCPHRELPLNF